MIKRILILASAIIIGQFSHAQQAKTPQPDYLALDKAINSVSAVMIHDVVNPPAAARYYNYFMMGAYNLVTLHNKDIVPIGNFIKSYKIDNTISLPANSYDYRIAAVYSILELGKQMLPSGFMLQDDEDKYIELLKKNNIAEAVIKSSVAVAVEMSNKVIAFSRSDNYNRLSGKLRYTPVKGGKNWYPTPPMYMEAVEPNWKTVRPMMIDSAQQFIPVRPTPFSTDSTSEFYRQAYEVYKISQHPSTEQLNIASFWDCNPFAVTTSGHMMIGFKKISPGGHWMNIAGIAVKKANLSFDASVQVLALEGITLMDAFISCWDEKYRSNGIRPETYINRYIDVKWMPFLQTPPFPEYPSGHAVLSNASATVLSYLLGDHFAYADDSEIPYGVGPRSFKSFMQAAEEASVSRFYGGIHFKDAIENGNSQGRQVGADIVKKLKAAQLKPLMSN
ncbi:vanadium-dependent haloperoxidase [Mucilaginibacter psychrotolerans]|uniref:Phosphatase PAP2 family protein n=1 Tax=Mucilaginibacter psychrotolerans TaxID=1524096 RepID=A0A4Y8SIK8_9SPHI|nr:vanadium-dependent haloperoxidase [Mucilaginibacter psychrotolerans]TFF38903.1 phosphatase PAP2 family protein [Mucilaginibacter psychrotolerans]